jgi:hypothetical protein
MSDSLELDEDDEEFVEMYHDNNFSDESGDTIDLIGETKENGNYQKPRNRGLSKRGGNPYTNTDFPTISERAEEYDDDASLRDMNKMKVIDSKDHKMKKLGDRDGIIVQRKLADKKRRKEEEEAIKRREKENKKRKKKEKKDKKKKEKKEKKDKKKKKKKDEEEDDDSDVDSADETTKSEREEDSEDEKKKKKRKKKEKKDKKKKKKKGKGWDGSDEEGSGSEEEEDADSQADRKERKKKKKRGSNKDDDDDESEDEDARRKRKKLEKQRAFEKEKEQAKKEEEKKYQIFEYDIQDTNMTFKTGAKPTVLTKTNIGHSLWLSAITFIPEKSLLVTGGYDDCKVKIWRLDPVTFNLSKVAEYCAHVGHITMLMYVADKDFLIIGSQDCSFSILSLKKIKKLQEGEEEEDVLLDDEAGSMTELEHRYFYIYIFVKFKYFFLNRITQKTKFILIY